jgi:hypothetical protein
LGAVGPEIAAIERRMGVRIEPGEDLYRTLAARIITAQINAAGDFIRGVKGLAPETVWSVSLATATAGKQITSAGEGFTAISERYIAERADLSASSRQRMQTAFRLFADYADNAPLAAVDRKTAARFIDTVAKLDPHWGQQSGSRGLPLVALLKRFPGRLSPATLNHYVSALNTLFDWARRNVSTILRQPSVEFKLGCLAISPVD